MARSMFGLGFGAMALCLAVVGCDDSCPTCVETTTQVRGFVRDGNGNGVEGVTIHVLGKPQVHTGSNGSFAFDDVATPYDLVYEAGPNDAITVWRGVTRRDPAIRGYTRVFVGPDTARVSGSAQALPGRTTIVFFMAPDAFVTGTTADVANMEYSLPLGWLADGRPRSGRIFLLRVLQDPSTHRVLEYDGFASQSLEAQPGGVYRVDLSSNVDDPLDRTLAGTVVVPAGYEAIAAQLWMEAEQQTASLGHSLLDGVDFALVAPTLPGVTYRVGVDAFSTDGARRRVFTARGGLRSWDRADIVMRPAPEPLIPQEDQEVGRATPLSWRDDGPPVLHIVRIHSSRTYVIHVIGTETRVDDLPGPGLVAGGNASWDLHRFDGQTAVEPYYRDSPRESFATSERVRFRVASEFAGPP